ncbi:MAG: hypothetical protein JO240_15780 [Solirubrobacterales bacterium]|nr:hypothetical protein [Solirubrobacterales bacterium]
METEASPRRSALPRPPLINRLRGTAAAPRSRITIVWAVMALVVVIYAAHQGLGLGGRGADSFFDRWVNDGLLWGAAVACLGGALRGRRGRAGWVLIAIALACWATGDTIWSVRFGAAPTPPRATISDVFWLAWYPLVAVALALLVRDRVPKFDLHRWIDGVTVMLVVATLWIVLFLEPVTHRSHAPPLVRALDFAYPLGDAVLFGATLGVFALMAWRPSRMWVALGIGLMVMGIADAAYTVDAAAHVHQNGIYNAAWTAGAALVAFASWEPHPGRLAPRTITGWPAIALPLTAQALAAAIQLYAFFHEVARSERLLTVCILIISMVQIAITRPRSPAGAIRDRKEP